MIAKGLVSKSAVHLPYSKIGAICTRRISTQHIEESYLPTSAFQKSLPHLFVPDLDKSVASYLSSQKALCGNEPTEEMCALVGKFHTTSAAVVQEHLLDFFHSNPNIMSKLLSDSVLKDRIPVVNHNSLYIISRSLAGPGYNNSIIRAANLVYSSLRFFKSLRNNKLRPDLSHNPNPSIIKLQTFDRFINMLPPFLATRGAYLFRVSPLNMGSYKYLFQSSRVPYFGMDRLESSEDSRHIVVISQGKFYYFEVFDHQGNMISRERLVANLKFIRALPRRPTDEISVGLITTMNREDASIARKRLKCFDSDVEGINTRNLKLLDSAVLLLVMCDEIAENLPLQISSTLMGFGGSRWFDKTLSLFVSQHGDAALNVADGLISTSAALRFANSIFGDAETRPAADPWFLESTQRIPHETVRRMEWHLDEAFYKEVLLPQHDVYQTQRADLQVAYLADEGGHILSKRLCDLARVSSDSMMQIAFLMAYERIHGETGFNGGSVEACSTRYFHGGGEALARPLTVEARDFLRLMRSKKILGFTGEDGLIETLHQCSRMHQSLLKDVATGHSWDSHLLALHQIAESDGDSLSVFNDETYKRIRNVDLFTTPLISDTASAEHLTGLLAGARFPISPSGYGVVYRITENGYSLCVTTRRESSSFSKASDFVEAFRKSLRQLVNLLQK